jgi:two-component system sensor histidine kinase YesM
MAGDRIKRRLKRTSLKSILLWIFIPVFIICVLVNLFLTNILVRRQVRENALASVSELVSQTKYHLDYRLYGIFEQLVLFEQSSDVAALITNTSENEIEHRQYFVKIFNAMERIYFSSYSVLESIFVATQQDNRPVDIFYKSDYPPSRSDFSFFMPLKGSPIVTQGEKSYQWYNLHKNEINPNAYTDNRIASLYKVLGDENSESRFFILFNFKNSFFQQIFGEIKAAENGYLALLGDGSVMHFNTDEEYGSMPAHILKTIEEDPRSSGDISYRDSGGSKMLAVWESLQLGHWKLAAVFPERDLMHSVDNIRLITVVCSLLAIGFALILSFLIIRVISNPITRWVSKVSNMDETSDVLLDDAICAEIVELNRGITYLMDRLQKLLKDKLIEESQKRKLEIRILQEQIKPHFLYNALDSTLQFGRIGEYKKMTELIMFLNGFYRLSLSTGLDIIVLKDEIAHAEYYLNIQMIHNKRIFYSLSINPELLGIKTVKLILQPLLENAVIHAVKHGEDLHLNIRAEKTADGIKIDIVDDGIGITEEKVDELNKALKTNDRSGLSGVYGLRNVHERIRLYYGVPYGLAVKSVFEQGTTVTILIPADGE